MPINLFRRSHLPAFLTGGPLPSQAPKDAQVRDWARQVKLPDKAVELVARVMEKELVRRTGTLDFSAGETDVLDRLPPTLLARLADYTRSLLLPADCPLRLADRLRRHLPRLTKVSPDIFMPLLRPPKTSDAGGGARTARPRAENDVASPPAAVSAVSSVSTAPSADEAIYDVPPRRVDDGVYKKLPRRDRRIALPETTEAAPLATERPRSPPPKQGRPVAVGAESTDVSDYDVLRSRPTRTHQTHDASRQRAALEEGLRTLPLARVKALARAIAVLKPAAVWASQPREKEAEPAFWPLSPDDANTVSASLAGLSPTEWTVPELQRPLLVSQRLLAHRRPGKVLPLGIDDIVCLTQAMRTAQQLAAATLGTAPDLPPPRRGRSPGAGR